MQNSETLRLNPPSLPATGGTINGLKGDMAGAGPDGAAAISIPLPVSAGRGYAPELTLTYHSQSGNGPFGMGWGVNLPAISRSTRKGTPAYTGEDDFTGPDGDVLVPVLSASGEAEERVSDRLLDVKLDGVHTVRLFLSRTQSSFSRLEYWQPRQNRANDFWVLYSPDGQVHLMGHNPQARISDPRNPARTALWLIESSVSATGEQIYYQYRAENDDDCHGMEIDAHPEAGAQRYLAAVHYGNLAAGRALPGLGNADPLKAGWLFCVMLDYGERRLSLSQAPGWNAENTWRCRPDCFSNHSHGFDRRTRRLCRQVLMFHRLATLAGNAQGEDTPALVSRLLLNYAENLSVSTLVSVRQVAHEPGKAGKTCALPPQEFGWQAFEPPASPSWQKLEDLGNLNPQQPWQLVDLNGEGLAGVLFFDKGAWWYRAPVRRIGTQDRDAVTWAEAEPLPAIPSLQAGAALADLDGKGRLQWLVTSAGIAGRYERTPEGEWLHFMPLSALPLDYFHPRAQLADMTGAGLSDLVLIGPKSVRIYAGKGDGWAKGRTIFQPEGITLPVPDADDTVLAAFSDLPGSGRQHLVEVRAQGVRYWPNLGNGRFGSPVTVAGFSHPAGGFDPKRVFMADIDGSGTMDLIYAQADHLEIYLNQSGNRFAPAFSVALPDGVRYDHNCSLRVADIQGLGVSSLLLTVAQPAPRHWICHLATHKPWLLNAVNNNLGARHSLRYRSSAQFWLDEKAQALASGKAAPACHLPVALSVLSRTETVDEITGNRLVSSVRYKHGVWDGCEREFRGFGYVEVQDTDLVDSRGTSGDVTMPCVSRRWFATGLPAVDRLMPQEYWQGDEAAFHGFTHRFTTGSGEDEHACTCAQEHAYWLNRAMKGMLLRSELYGAEGTPQASVPYSVTENRLQVRLIEPRGRYPAVWPVVAESRSYVYERTSSDPQCSQTVLLASDALGRPLRQVSINYPRRGKPAVNPYPRYLPDSLFSSSYDTQQQKLRLVHEQQSWHGLLDLEKGTWLPALIDAVRTDVHVYPPGIVPAAGFSLETLPAAQQVTPGKTTAFAGQQQTWYLDDRGKATTATPAMPPRVAFTETALLCEALVKALAGAVTATELAQAGYRQCACLFAHGDEKTATLWAARRGHAAYADASHFHLPLSYRETLLTAAVTVMRDRHDCVITQYQDAAGLTTRAEYDWRFLTPLRITDANDNVHSVTLDALGRVITARYHGTEEGKNTGYGNSQMDIPADVASALALTAPLPVAQCAVYAPDSWMQGKSAPGRLPPHVLILSTDRYDSDPAQQIRQQVMFSDGFGRPLQNAVRHPAGQAWQRADDGSLVKGGDGKPLAAFTALRWSVSGRMEYDNKGQPVRIYQPYFLNDWRYVSDDSARQDCYADTHFYDPVGRETSVLTANGHLRRTLYTPWFVVSEDENDTASYTAGPAVQSPLRKNSEKGIKA